MIHLMVLLLLLLVLLVVGFKMLTAKWLKATLGDHFNLYLLMAVFAIIAVGVIASLIADARSAKHQAS